MAPNDLHTLFSWERWAITQVIAEALGRSLSEQKVSRTRAKFELEGFKNFFIGGLVQPLTITPKGQRPGVELKMFIVIEGKLM